jgi:hypothetical protein
VADADAKKGGKKGKGNKHAMQFETKDAPAMSIALQGAKMAVSTKIHMRLIDQNAQAVCHCL